MSSSRTVSKNWLRGLAITQARREELSTSLKLQDPIFALYEQRIRDITYVQARIERLNRFTREDIELKNFLDQELEFNNFHYLERLGAFA